MFHCKEFTVGSVRNTDVIITDRNAHSSHTKVGNVCHLIGDGNLTGLKVVVDPFHLANVNEMGRYTICSVVIL